MKLHLDRDFTRYQCDDSFPHKVTVCVGEDKLFCSGALIAQQSSVLERKFIRDGGILNLEEMTEFGKRDQLIQCINYLHGADLDFSFDNIDIVLKFSSWYEVEDLFKKSVNWAKKQLNEDGKVEHLLYFLKISDAISSYHRFELLSALTSYMKKNSPVLEKAIIACLALDLTISGTMLVTILDRCHKSYCSTIAREWASKSTANKNFILKNPNLFDFKSMFPKSDEFGLFVTTLSGGSESLETMKLLVNVQQNYLVGIADYTSSSVGEDSYRITSSLLEDHTINETVDEDKEALYNESADVCIGNVPSTATRKGLIGLFKFAGWIDRVHFDRPTKTAMIKFAEVNSATTLLACSEPFYLDNCELEIGIENMSFVERDEVKKITSNRCEVKDPEVKDNNVSSEVLVSNLPPKATCGLLVKTFRFAGWINNVVFNHDNHSAVLFFKKVESADHLLSFRFFQLDGFEVSLRRVSQDASLESYEFGYEEDYNDVLDRTNALYVSNIPTSANKGHLINIFKFAGWIDDIKFNRDLSVVIYFQDPESVDFLMFECDLNRFVLFGQHLYLERLLE